MDKKILLMLLIAFTLLTMNVCAAHEVDNVTDVDLEISEEPSLEVSGDTSVLAVSKESTSIEGK